MLPLWAGVMGRKTWAAVSETVGRKGIAAWQWLLVGHPNAKALASTQGRPPPKLDAALCSRLVLPEMVLQNVSTHEVAVSHGNAV